MDVYIQITSSLTGQLQYDVHTHLFIISSGQTCIQYFLESSNTINKRNTFIYMLHVCIALHFSHNYSHISPHSLREADSLQSVFAHITWFFIERFEWCWGCNLATAGQSERSLVFFMLCYLDDSDWLILLTHKFNPFQTGKHYMVWLKIWTSLCMSSYGDVLEILKRHVSCMLLFVVMNHACTTDDMNVVITITRIEPFPRH